MDIIEVKSHLSTEAFYNIERWLIEPKYAEYRNELVEMIAAERWQQLEDAFFKVIEFGTAGRRGATGLGSNRINRVTIGESAQALCEYAKQHDGASPGRGVVIACDTRLSSPDLSQYVAEVCAAAGFKTYVFDGYRSTPELSFAVRFLGCAIGIVVSASHNPPADNGFKAYWSDGGQLISPHDKGVLAAAQEINIVESVLYEDAIADGRIEVLEGEVDDKYIQAVKAESVSDLRNVSIVYSPLHGAGQRNTLPVLKEAGFSSITIVEEQMTPDGNFPTIKNQKPNPEEKVANEMAAQRLLKEKADIAITNDPDADRLGVMVRTNDGVEYLSGNQTAILAVDYTLSQMRENGDLSAQHYVAKTIVTTEMIQEIANYYGVKCYGNLLVGFKYFAELIRKSEAGPEQFVIGAEESFGLLKGSYARDKDGASGALIIAEATAKQKAEGRTLFDHLMELYKKHGLFLERTDNIMCPGADGFERMEGIMQGIRQHPPTSVGDNQVTAVIDYSRLIKTDVASGESGTIDGVLANMVVLELDNDSRRQLILRPSGTEPKLKVYIKWYEKAHEDVRSQYDDQLRYLEFIGQQFESIVLSK